MPPHSLAANSDSNGPSSTSLVDQLQESWRQGQQPHIGDFVGRHTGLTAAQLAALLRVDQQQRWRIGQCVPAEEYLERFPALSDDIDSVLDVIYSEFLVRESLGEEPSAEEFANRFPQFTSVLKQQIALHLALRMGEPQSSCDEQPFAQDRRSTMGRRGPTLEAPGPSVADKSWVDEQGMGGSEPLPQFPGYEILAKLGRGGMAIVYRARHKSLDRMVALKVLSANLRGTPQALQRLRNEAIAIARLQHPHIVQVYEVGEHHGTVYLSLELVEGGTLADRFRGTALPPRQAALLLTQLVQAVEHAHQQGVIHRDLKPGNVLLQTESSLEAGNSSDRMEQGGRSSRPSAVSSPGSAKISDFGLAKILQAAEVTDTEATREGDLLGTPSYMAPEQARGEPGAATPAADIYALGAILYELLTGRPPYQGASSLDILQQVLHQDPIRPSRLVGSLPRDLETICLKCLERQPEKRYPNTQTLSQDLTRYLAGEPILARRAGMPERCWKWVRRYPRESISLAVVALLLSCLGGGFAWHRQQQQQARVAALVDALMVAEPTAVPRIVERLGNYPHSSRRALEFASRATPVGSTARLHLCIAQLRGDPKWADELANASRFVGPRDIDLLSQTLRPHLPQVGESLWRIAADPDAPLGERLATACILANGTSDDSRWPQVASPLVAQLVNENPLHAGLWSHALLPVRAHFTPELQRVFGDEQSPPSQRLIAASILVEYASDNPALLVELLLVSTPEQYAVLLPSVQRNAEQVETRLEIAVNERAAESIPEELDGNSSGAAEVVQRRVAQARRQAIAAIALAQLGRAAPLRDVLRLSADPTARTLAIERAGRSGLPARWFADRLEQTDDVSIQRACVLAVGGYEPQLLPRVERQALLTRLAELYLSDPDPGLRGAVTWLLRKWSESPPAEPDVGAARIDVASGLGWYTNTEGQSFAILPAADITLGSPMSEEDHESDEVLRPYQIERPFAIAMREVTLAEFLRFRPNADTNAKYNPHSDGPAGNISWFDAAAYCRWLSERDGIAEDQMCFPPLGQIKPGLRLPDDYLRRHGYRLPTEAEWEYACRSGTSTSWSFGIDTESLDQYGFSLFNSKNRAWPVGLRKPNDFGLSDMHGNVQEWCVDSPSDDSSLVEGRAGQRPVDQSARRVRGGSFSDVPLSTRSARRTAQPANSRWAITGFRPVRTWTTSPR